MKMLISLFSILSFFGGAVVLMDAKSAIHEILAGVLFILWALFMCAAAILDLLEKNAKASSEQTEQFSLRLNSILQKLKQKDFE